MVVVVCAAATSGPDALSRSSVRHTDTVDSTCLHVPSLELVVAGDTVYNGTHPYLAETNEQTRLEWIAALDKIETLKGDTVIAAHKVPEGDNSPRHIEATRKSIRDFNRADGETRTAEELYQRMLRLYPDHVNPGSLWAAAHAAKKSFTEAKVAQPVENRTCSR
jgi:glyoxylase-like metal-dependent hydrolase (beta-lactamase superfamily II)